MELSFRRECQPGAISSVGDVDHHRAGERQADRAQDSNCRPGPAAAQRIDPMKIRQVLINLLSNAAKFTEQGSITVEAELSAAGRDWTGERQVIVRVIDTGPGIAPEDQAKLFQPFSQVDGSLTRKTGGSGLGLSICQHLIRLHGGQIGLESEVGHGTTFYFTLPVQQPTEGHEQAPAVSSRSPASLKLPTSRQQRRHDRLQSHNRWLSQRPRTSST